MIPPYLTGAVTIGMMVAPASVSIYRMHSLRDPFTCGCLHLPSCAFYVAVENDPRAFVRAVENSDISPSAQKIEEQKMHPILYILQTTGEGVLRVLMLPWLVTRFAEHYESVAECHCTHASSCALAPKKVIVPPPGCEGWTYRDGGYQHPTSGTWTIGLEVEAPKKSWKFKKHDKKTAISNHASSSVNKESKSKI